MKKIQHLSSRITLILCCSAFALLLGACHPAEGTQTAPTDQPAVQSAGNFDLPDPAAGLNSLTGYRQTLTISTSGTLDGKAYESIQTLERTSIGDNELVNISETTTGSTPVNLLYAIVDGYRYSLENKEPLCRAAPQEAETNLLPNPASQLPSISGAADDGTDTINDIAALRYTFDETNVSRRSGKNDHANGDLWVAEEGGYLVKYLLTADLSSENFTGTRSWSYELLPLTANDSIQLPDPCQPMYFDLPALQDAAEMILQPGFQQYTTRASRTEVVEFYNEALPAQGWQALPGSRPGEMDLAASVQTLAYTHDAPDGSTLLVILVDEKDGSLRITVQSLTVTQEPQPNFTEPADTPETPDTATDEPQASLPEDLPVYPGAAVINRTESFLMLETSDSIEEVVLFYKDEMTGLEWTLDNEMDQAGIIVQSWTKNDASLVITLTESQGKVQIMITPTD